MGSANELPLQSFDLVFELLDDCVDGYQGVGGLGPAVDLMAMAPQHRMARPSFDGRRIPVMGEAYFCLLEQRSEPAQLSDLYDGPLPYIVWNEPLRTQDGYVHRFSFHSTGRAFCREPEEMKRVAPG
jgi:hypothetical protein